MEENSEKNSKVPDPEELARERFFSEHIMDHSRSMLSIINRLYRYEKVNATFCNAHQGMVGSIVGKSLSEIWGCEIFSTRIRENIDRCFNGETVRYEASFSVPQSGRRFFEVIFRPMPEKDGKITHLLAETFDITDLKLSEKTAEEKEEEFRKFETNLPIGFLRCKPDGTILHANRTFLIIMDVEDEGALCSTCLRDYYAEPGLFDIHIDQLLDNKPKSFGRVSLVTCRKNQIVCRISAFMMHSSTGEPLYIDYSMEDLSRELMLENRLLQAQKLETIGSLAGGIAHDFNNILTTISGYAELLHDDLGGQPSALAQIKKIQMAVLKARSLTSQILTFSRQVEQEKIPVKVTDVLKETLGFIESSIPGNINLSSKIFTSELTVMADPTQLFRVFLNLLTNAIQALEGRKGNINVGLSVLKGEQVHNDLNTLIVHDEYVVVTISDTGKGMDPALIGRIFEPFFTTREVGKGSGLGLSVVHGIVTEMGGEILVSSRQNEGSVFSLYLPVTRDLQNQEEFTGEKRKILIVPGNIHETRVLSIALETSGFEVITTKSLSHLLKSVTGSYKPDLIIFMTDNSHFQPDDLPGIIARSGYFIPCIVITEPGQDILIEKLMNTEFVQQQLVKPVSLKEIRNAIKLSIR
jgi:signal transduction histidine kinase